MYYFICSLLFLGISTIAHAQSGVGTPWQFVHTPAGSCLTDVGVAAIARLDQLCLDGDDNDLWRCKTPGGAGANALFCDTATEWAGVGPMISWNGRTGAVVPVAGDYTGAHITNVPAGGVTESTVQGAIDGLETRKASLATLESNDGTINQVGDLVSWNKLKDVPAGFADGTDADSGVGGGSAQGLQANADINRAITNAIAAGSAVNTGGASQYVQQYGNVSEGAVTKVVGGPGVWQLADTFSGKIVDNTGASIAEFDNETKNVLIPNTLTVTGSLVAPGVVKQNTSTDAPTVNDDADVYPVGSLWIHTTPNPDAIYICTDNTLGAAVWVPYSSFTQVDKGLNDAFNVQKNITGAYSEANAFCVGDGTGQKCSWYDIADGWHEVVTPAGHHYIDIPSTFAFILRYNGTEIVRWDSTGNQKWLNQGKPAIAIPWSAAGVETDGTACATQAQSNVNAGGLRVQDFGCVAFTTSTGKFYQILEMRPAWDGTGVSTAGITFTLRLRTLGTSSALWKADVALWCVRDGDAYPTDTNFDTATAQEVSITTGTTANVRRSMTTTAIIPGGTCTPVAGVPASVVFRVKTKSGHTATDAFAKIVGGYLEPKYAQLGD